MTIQESLKIKADYHFSEGAKRPRLISGKMEILKALMFLAVATGDIRLYAAWLPEPTQDRG